jgi:protein-tyrosine-phosphatase
MYHILIVCTGNTCRSPMAEGILRSLLGGDLAEMTRVSSAGTSAATGIPATDLAIRTCGEEKIDISGHGSVPLTPALLREADLVLAMEPHHVEHARRLAPDAGDRIHLITERGAASGTAALSGVSDPLGGSAEQYRDTFNRIRSHLLGWVPVIREAIERREGARRSSDA